MSTAFTAAQLAVIPVALQQAFLNYCNKGMRPTKAAARVGIILSQHDSQLLSAKIDDISFAMSESDIANVYADTNKGQSCMTTCPNSPAYVYATIGAQVAHNAGARVVVNPVSKMFGRIYGERSSDLFYSLLAMGYTESNSPLAGLSGNLKTRVEAKLVTLWRKVDYCFETHAEDSLYLVGHHWQEGEQITHNGQEWIACYHGEYNSEKYTHFRRLVGVVKRKQTVVYKIPSKFYLDGTHTCILQGSKLTVMSGGAPHYVTSETIVKMAIGHTIHRKVERKGMMDIVSDIERRMERWKY